jgi:hypothetical protein
MLIYLKGCYTILGKIHSNSKEYRFQFKVPLKDKTSIIIDIISVNIISNEGIVESFGKYEVSKEMWDVLQTDICDGETLSLGLQAELKLMTSNISKATKKVLYLIKYCFNCPDLNDDLFSVKDVYWSIDKSKWKSIPMITYATLDIQNYIENDFEPFFALRHLHKAKKESNPRHKWIDATIAAELAIKEFLIRLKPDIETLLLEVPSPPIYKLYGPILEFYTKKKSPKLKELTKGAEKRNTLIHRPKDILIDDEQANEYIHDVETAIYHLLTLLYPNDHIMKHFYRPE